MSKEEIDNAEGIILKALAEKNCNTDILLQPWMDGFLIHVYNEFGKHKTTVGGENLYAAIEKL